MGHKAVYMGIKPIYSTLRYVLSLHGEINITEDEPTGSKHAVGRMTWFVTNVFWIVVGFHAIVIIQGHRKNGRDLKQL